MLSVRPIGGGSSSNYFPSLVWSGITPNSGVNSFYNFIGDQYYVGRYSPFKSLALLYQNGGTSFSVPLSFSYVPPTDSDTCLFNYDPSPIVGYEYDGVVYYIRPSYSVRGTLTFQFSDGSSKVFNVNQSSALSFQTSFHKSSNQFVLTSDDFNLSNSNGSVSSNGVNGVPNAHITMQQASIYSQVASFRPVSGSTIGTFSASLADISSVVSDIAISSGSFDLSKSNVSESVVELTPVSSNLVTISRVVFSGNIIFFSNYQQPLYLPDGVDSLDFFYIGIARCFALNSSETVLGDIYSQIKSIGSYLRFDLPLQLRHLIIPTTEEVQDLFEDSLEDFKEKSPAAAGTIDTVQNSFDNFKVAISSSDTRGLTIPGISVSLPGSSSSIKLWEDFDVMPYLNSQPVQMILVPAVLMLKALVFFFVVKQLFSMVMALINGFNYLQWIMSGHIDWVNEDYDSSEMEHYERFYRHSKGG